MPTPLGLTITAFALAIAAGCVAANALRKAVEQAEDDFADADPRLERLCRFGEGARFSHSTTDTAAGER